MQITVQNSGDCTILRIEGRFDFNTQREFRETTSMLLQDTNAHVVQIDLGDVDYIDSSALGMLLMFRDKLRAANKTISLANCRGSVKQVLDIAKFDKLFPMN